VVYIILTTNSYLLAHSTAFGEIVKLASCLVLRFSETVRSDWDGEDALSRHGICQRRYVKCRSAITEV